MAIIKPGICCVVRMDQPAVIAGSDTVLIDGCRGTGLRISRNITAVNHAEDPGKSQFLFLKALEINEVLGGISRADFQKI